MEKKFKINKEKINRIISEYNNLCGNATQEERIKYQNQLLSAIGTDVLTKAIDEDILRRYIDLMLNQKQAHDFYSNEEFLMMIEGISNFEIVGDWQHFLTINPEYIFDLPHESQEKFAENFSIGNIDLKNCLLDLWKNKIETTGVDTMRPEAAGSTYNITIKCFATNVECMTEIIRKINSW